jgi:hypothetical protein
MESQHTLSRYVARIGAGILLMVSVEACGSQAGAPATSTPPAATPSATAVATTPPTPITLIPTTAAAVSTSTPRPATPPVRPAQPTTPPARTPIASGQIAFAALGPAPGSVSHRSTAITFTVRAPLPITSLRVSLDGTVVTPEVGGRDQRDLSAFYQPPHWTTGRHTVVATAVAGKQTVTRSWSFTID